MLVCLGRSLDIGGSGMVIFPKQNAGVDFLSGDLSRVEIRAQI